MNGTPTPDELNNWPWLTAWEAGKFLGLPIENILAGWEDKTLPPPRVLSPVLRWHEDDLIEHLAQHQGNCDE